MILEQQTADGATITYRLATSPPGDAYFPAYDRPIEQVMLTPVETFRCALGALDADTEATLAPIFEALRGIKIHPEGVDRAGQELADVLLRLIGNVRGRTRAQIQVAVGCALRDKPGYFIAADRALTCLCDDKLIRVANDLWAQGVVRLTKGGEFEGAQAGGVSLSDLALLYDDDPALAKDLVKRWNNSRKPKPDSIGKDPLHIQRPLFKPAAILAWVKKVEGRLPNSEKAIKQALSRKAREPLA